MLKWFEIFSETFELKNLKSNVTYLVRCAVANAAAVSDFSSAIRVTTEVVAYTPTDKDVVQGTLFIDKSIFVSSKSRIEFFSKIFNYVYVFYRQN